eukprot:499903-Rhodomonas_salina.1
MTPHPPSVSLPPSPLVSLPRVRLSSCPAWFSLTHLRLAPFLPLLSPSFPRVSASRARLLVSGAADSP